MTIYDEVDMLIEQLTAAWGSVLIVCDGQTCFVSNPAPNGHPSRSFQAPTLLDALRLAVQDSTAEGAAP